MVDIRVRLVGFRSGERFPVLSIAGHLAERPILYLLDQRRLRCSASTLEQDLWTILLLYRACLDSPIDAANSVEARFADGRYYGTFEVAQIIEDLGRRRSRPNAGYRVTLATHIRRVKSASSYLTWLAFHFLDGMAISSDVFRARRQAIEDMQQAFKARCPRMRSGAVSFHQGLSPVQKERLLQLVDPLNPDNPWQDDFIRTRNQLVVHYLLLFGLRRGELLAIRLNDLRPDSSAIMIPRRPDDQDDPRVRNPNNKTLPRVLSITTNLWCLTDRYLKYRRLVEGSKRTPFLLIGNSGRNRGRPLSLGQLDRIFECLQATLRFPEINVTPHTLRRTWNEWFSTLCDGQHISREMEELIRKYLMGWSLNSKMTGVYTRRHVEQKSSEYLLDLQKWLLKNGGDVE